MLNLPTGNTGGVTLSPTSELYKNNIDFVIIYLAYRLPY